MACLQVIRRHYKVQKYVHEEVQLRSFFMQPLSLAIL